MKRRLLITTLLLALLAALALAGAAALVRRAAAGKTFSDAAAIPARRVGLVLGCANRLPDGRRNLFFIRRIEAAAALFHAGKVRTLIVSGDNHVSTYDEVTDMKDELAHHGVPVKRIYCDYAGFRTFDSVIRAREIFGQTEFTVISQRFHNERAIFIAQHAHLDVIGFNAADVGAIGGFLTGCREQLARVKTVLDVYVLPTKPKFLGPKVEIRAAGTP